MALEIFPPQDGDVLGPASATNNHVAVFDGVTGKRIKDGGALSGGTVTSVSVSDGVGTTGSVATSTTTPDITIDLDFSTLPEAAFLPPGSPTVSVVDYMEVSGAGTEAANGLYSPRPVNSDTLSAVFRKEGQSVGDGLIRVISDGKWRFIIDGLELYITSNAPESPVDGVWIQGGDEGALPVPTVTAVPTVVRAPIEALLGYKEYVAAMSGGSGGGGGTAPTAEVNTDTLGVSVAWSYVGTGHYRATLGDNVITSSFWGSSGVIQDITGVVTGFFTLAATADNAVDLYVSDTAFHATDELLLNTGIAFRL